MLLIKPDDLKSVARTHTVWETDSQRLSLDLHMSTVTSGVSVCIHAHVWHNWINLNIIERFKEFVEIITKPKFKLNRLLESPIIIRQSRNNCLVDRVE